MKDCVSQLVRPFETVNQNAQNILSLIVNVGLTLPATGPAKCLGPRLCGQRRSRFDFIHTDANASSGIGEFSNPCKLSNRFTLYHPATISARPQTFK
jgi:hypothetical protein